MDSIARFKQTLLLCGDLLIFYGSLAATLLIRYRNLEAFPSHFWPFTLIFILWISIIYIIGLYELQSLKNDPSFTSKIGWTFAVNAVIAIVFFYLITDFGIAPKVNLFILLAIVGLTGYGWRTLYNVLLNRTGPTSNILLVGVNAIAERLAVQLEKNPQIGYRVAYWMKGGLEDKEFRHLSAIILTHRITTIVVPAHVKKNLRAARRIYNSLILGIEVVDLAEVYERIMKKVPLPELEEVWFLENLAKRHRVYETIKHPVEFMLAFLLFLATLPLSGLIALVTLSTSRGPIIFSQVRVGKGGANFRLYKFRTMRRDAEKDGPRWASARDERVTAFGRFLRRSHLDELPQLWNMLRGELSLIGPRPERPEFVTTLREQIPYYDLRHLVKPGITGWAQVNYRYGGSIEDAYEKLQYEMYYLKNRSLMLDFLITLKTLKFFFSNLT